MLHKDVCDCIGTFVEPDCLLRLDLLCRHFVSAQLWRQRAQQLLAVVLDDTRHAVPQNLVLLKLYHGPKLMCRSISSIRRFYPDRQTASGPAEGPVMEKADFEVMESVELPRPERRGMRKMLDDWLCQSICKSRSVDRQLLVSSEVNNPDILKILDLSVNLQIWVWEGEEFRVLSPEMPLRLVSQDREGFQLHFVHLPFAGCDFSNCIDLLIEVDALRESAAVAMLRGRVVPKELLAAGAPEGSRQEEVVVAFRKTAPSESEPDPVFCFLPVRCVGFRFALHAPWALTSNREDFHLEDPWNVWLRSLAAKALAAAIEALGNAEASESGPGNLLSLLDGRRVLEPFWRRLLEEAAQQLNDAPVVPVLHETKLYRPSEVLVPPPALLRSTGALRFLHALPGSGWPFATGKRLARVGTGEKSEEAEEDARRLLSLKAEALSSRRLARLLNSGPVGLELKSSCRVKGFLFSHLAELLNAWLAEHGPQNGAVRDAEGSSERLVELVADIQRMQAESRSASVRESSGDGLLRSETIPTTSLTQRSKE
eukprot:g363.t1